MPGDLFLSLFTFGDKVIGWVELKYMFGLEFGFYMNMFFGEQHRGIVIFLELTFGGSGFRIGSFLGISYVLTF